MRKSASWRASGPLRVLVTGSRAWTDRGAIRRRICRLPPGSVVIQGCARGADRLARQAAQDYGVEVLDFLADWDKEGRAAGFRRNERMLREGRPDVVWAFPLGRSPGTRHMMAIARHAGIPVEDLSGSEVGLKKKGDSEE